ncbi:MAG TPA: hypothetical protein ENI95_01920 [Chloroflexi bacterium]|nr:hypothetical protein [Chloroflexota bacterium]
MDVYPIVLRLLHIGGGVFWAGSTFFMAFLMSPAVRMAGEGGQQYMRTLTQRTPLATFMSVSSLLNVISGILLYWRASAGFRSNWMASGMGITLAIGGLAGLIATVIGTLVNRSLAEKIGALGKEIQASGGPPTPEQLAQMRKYQAGLASALKWSAVLLAISVVTMAVARYV